MKESVTFFALADTAPFGYAFGMIYLRKVNRLWRSNMGILPATVRSGVASIERWAATRGHALTELIIPGVEIMKPEIPKAILEHVGAIEKVWASLTETERIAIGHIRINCQTGGATVLDRPESTRGNPPGALRL